MQSITGRMRGALNPDATWEAMPVVAPSATTSWYALTLAEYHHGFPSRAQPTHVLLAVLPPYEGAPQSPGFLVFDLAQRDGGQPPVRWSIYVRVAPGAAPPQPPDHSLVAAVRAWYIQKHPNRWRSNNYAYSIARRLSGGTQTKRARSPGQPGGS